MDTNKQAPRETYRGKMIADCVAAGMDLGLAKPQDENIAAVTAGYTAMRLDRYVEMLEGLVNGEDLIRVQALIAARYHVRREEA